MNGKLIVEESHTALFNFKLRATEIVVNKHLAVQFVVDLVTGSLGFFTNLLQSAARKPKMISIL
jgi:hypothetical protein